MSSIGPKVFFLAIVLLPLEVLAQADAAPQDHAVPEDLTHEKILEQAKKKKKEGWRNSLNLGANASYNHSRSVVGAPDGSTVQIGVVLEGKADLYKGRHIWENRLKLLETQTRQPQLGKFIKANDLLDFSTTYMYRLKLDWIGPYARGRFQTQVFKGHEVRTDPTTVIRTLRDGSMTTENVAATDRIPITGAFEPMLFRESAGVFLRPLETDKITINGKVGIAAQHIAARDGFSVTDDDTTPELELTQLQDSNQGGGEADFEFNGRLSSEVTWEARAQFFLPFASSVDGSELGFDGLNTELTAKLSVKLAEWASLDYLLIARRIPLILDRWQVQNGLLLTAAFELI